MEKEKEVFRAFDVLQLKEQMLGEIVVWLKTKGLWEECQKSLSVKVVKNHENT